MPDFSLTAAERFAALALACVHKEYPNKIGHVLNSDADVAPPRQLTPAFYGCFDWHSSVHGHWLLARLARTFPGAPFTPKAIEALQKSLTRVNLEAEARYLNGEGRASFERPYGLAWLLQLGQELREWDHPASREMAANLRPLEDAATARLRTWLFKLSHPVRSGEHSQTAFALGLMLDAGRDADKRSLGPRPRTTQTGVKVDPFPTLATVAADTARKFYLGDKNCPLAYDLSGEDFLSPCLAEADVMRRVLPPAEFARWLRAFLPGIPVNGSAEWLHPAVVTDPSDPKLAHLDGLNLSRAWMLEGIASGLPANDRRLASLRAAAAAHRTAGVASVTGAHYEGGHWLGSFAVYLVTARGMAK
jgi:hypothetical protein